MKKGLVILLCLLMTLFLSSCQIHIDTDPWPASPDYVESEITITQEPVTTVTDAPQATVDIPVVMQTVAPVPTTTVVPQQPEVTAAPTQETLVPMVTSTPAPSDEVVEPGFNG